MPNETASIAVCLSTRHRPEGLARALESVAAQRLPEPAPPLVAIVVNNDPADDRPAGVVAAIRARTGLRVELLVEPRRGVAPPRNRALAAAIAAVGEAGLVAFLDDDEEAPPQWLATLLLVKRRFGAEIVTGPVEPRFAAPPPAWIESGGFFARQRHPTGSRRRWAFTNNVLFEARLPSRLDRWFDERFERLSEDRHFFERLARSGAAIVWADEAAVVEDVPASRLHAGWITARLRTVGRCVGPLRRDLDGSAAAWANCLGKGIAWLAIGGATAAAGAVAGRATRVRGRSWIAYGVGLLEGVALGDRAGRPPRIGD
jgi:succinoglycan biosynthesis protein ExoM